jgi:uncharacterized membrane protein
MAIGYLFGIITSASIRWFTQNEFNINLKKKITKYTYYIFPIFIIFSLIMGFIWQNDVNELISQQSIGIAYSVTVIISTILFFIVFFFIGRLIRKLYRAANNYLSRRVPVRISALVAVLTSILIIYFVVSGVFVSSFYKVADGIFGARDGVVPDLILQPTSSNRSGSPDSLIAWEEIGFQGRNFVGTGPTVEQIEEFNAEPARDPIRIYAGLSSADTAEARAQLAVEELIRTDAFSREVLVIASATGTGWIDPSFVDALEFVYGGNSAFVTQQYSYLPSWISFLVDQQRAKEAGRVLYDAVLEELLKIEESKRPKLFVYGLSLGSFAAQDAFSGVNDIRRAVDGAMFVGTPNVTRVWRNVTDNRDSGSLEWQPIYREGKSVRFASTNEEIVANSIQWSDKTRILYLQNSNDPVVWFNFDLIFNRPDWLVEKRGPYVSEATRWYPIITFLHVGLDQAVAASAPLGQAHYYTDLPVQAWLAIDQEKEISVNYANKLQSYLDNEFISDRLDK